MAKFKRKKRPEPAVMFADLERREADYWRRIVKEAVDWPSQGFSTKELIRKRIAADWDALMATRPEPPEQKGTYPMRKSEMFPSQFLKAPDIGDGELGDEATVTIRGVRREANKFDADKSNTLLAFEEYGRELILNQTNADVLFAALDDDSDLWIGREIVLYVTSVKTPEGSTVPGIRIRVAKPNGAKQEPQASREKRLAMPPPPPPPKQPPIDDDIPF